MRISDFYKLGRHQGSLDFVDVTLHTDVPVFISPRALKELDNEWAQSCLYSIQNYFEYVIFLIKAGSNQKARNLLASLKEPNETRLGLSKMAPAGRALGESSATNVWHSLSQSQAAKSGLIRDLEDAALFVPGVGRDIISDITTNLIRRQLIQYTQDMMDYYGIPGVQGVVSGPLWNPVKKNWEDGYTQLPVPNGYGKLILVPKSIVRLGVGYDGSEYYRYYLMEAMKHDEIKRGSALVEIVKKTKKPRVTKKSLEEKYGSDKQAVVDQTLRFPDELEKYKRVKDGQPSLPLSHEQLATAEDSTEPDWDQLISNVTSLQVGRDFATEYENCIESLISALFYPCLTQPSKQTPIHDGRKRLDITYTNMGVGGFFKWLQNNYTCPKMMIECKNYGSEIANPELDQITGRFSPSRGKVGILVCRNLKNESLMTKRCQDTAKDDRGFVVVLTDKDLIELVEERKKNIGILEFSLLMKKFEKLIF